MKKFLILAILPILCGCMRYDPTSLANGYLRASGRAPTAISLVTSENNRVCASGEFPVVWTSGNNIGGAMCVDGNTGVVRELHEPVVVQPASAN